MKIIAAIVFIFLVATTSCIDVYTGKSTSLNIIEKAEQALELSKSSHVDNNRD